MIELIVNDRMGRKARVKCNPDDTIENFKLLIAAQTGTHPDRIRLQKGNNVLKDPLAIEDYELTDGCTVELYYD